MNPDEISKAVQALFHVKGDALSRGQLFERIVSEAILSATAQLRKENEKLRSEIKQIEADCTVSKCRELEKRNFYCEVENVQLREALDQLASVCTCARPAFINEQGASVAPGPHTNRCVSVIALKALSTYQHPPTQEQEKK